MDQSISGGVQVKLFVPLDGNEPGGAGGVGAGIPQSSRAEAHNDWPNPDDPDHPELTPRGWIRPFEMNHAASVRHQLCIRCNGSVGKVVDRWQLEQHPARRIELQELRRLVCFAHLRLDDLQLDAHILRGYPRLDGVLVT